MIAELCRDVAFEAARRSPGVNPDELWAVLEEIEAAGAVQLVDLGSDAAVVQAWWSLGLRVVTVQADMDAVGSVQLLYRAPGTTTWTRHDSAVNAQSLVGLAWPFPPNRPNDRSVLSPWMADWGVPGWRYDSGNRVPA